MAIGILTIAAIPIGIITMVYSMETEIEVIHTIMQETEIPIIIGVTMLIRRAMTTATAVIEISGEAE